MSPSRLVSIAVGLCGVLLLASPASAKWGQPKDPSQRLDQLDKKLELTDEQRVQVEQILQDYHTRAQVLRQQGESLRKDKHDKMNAVLTPDQQAKYGQMKTRHWWRRKSKSQSE